MKVFRKRPDLPQQEKKGAQANVACDESIIITKNHWVMYSKELKDEFIPKPSARTRDIKEFWKDDGDTWVEINVFTGKVKRSSKERVYRSLFLSVNLKIAYWDEPPTGASRVIWLQDNKTNDRQTLSTTDTTLTDQI
jgi:hypothetical protein